MVFSRSFQITLEELKSLILSPLPKDGGILENHFIDEYSGKFCDVLFSAPYFNYLGCGNINPANYGALLVLVAYY